MSALQSAAAEIAPRGGDDQARSTWGFSLPLLVGVYVFLISLYRGGHGHLALGDGDTYLHVAAGHWILANRMIPASDPFSHSVPGSPWVAHEWLAEIVFALGHDLVGWTGLVALVGLCFALAASLLVRALLDHLSPTRSVLLAAIAVLMTMPHFLVRPHMLALPLMVAWMAGLVRAVDRSESPPWKLLPLMALWANIHGGFTLGLAFAVMLGLEAALGARKQPMRALKPWGVFVGLAVLASMLTPSGWRGLLFTYELMVQDKYALSRIGEWLSPNFHTFQPLSIWLLGGFALALHQGLRLPPVRLVLVIGLLFISLRHVRNVELVGFIGPLLIAAPLREAWRNRDPAESSDRVKQWLSRGVCPAGAGALAGCMALGLCLTFVIARISPSVPPQQVAPTAAISAAKAAGVRGNVLNGYSFGGWLLLDGHKVFIDGRSDVFRDLMRDYLDALELKPTGDMVKLLEEHRIGWTLLDPGTPAITLLDRLEGWERIYADDFAVVHSRRTQMQKRAVAGDRP